MLCDAFELNFPLPNEWKESRGAVGVAGGNAEALPIISFDDWANCLAECADIERPLGSGGTMLSRGVWGDICSCRPSTGLAEERSFLLAFGYPKIESGRV